MAIGPGTDTKSELEQYGVWVKAEPQDIVDDDASAPGTQAPGQGPVEARDELADQSFLSEDEEKLLGSFDAEFESPPPSALPDIDDIPALDEPMLSEEPASLSATPEGDSAPQAFDLSLEEPEDAAGSSASQPGVEIDMSSAEGLDNPGTPRGETDSSIEDVSSEFLDMPLEPETSGAPAAAPLKSAAGMDDVTAEFLDTEGAASAPKGAEDSSSDFESLDIDLHFDDALGDSQASAEKAKVDDGGFEAVTEFDDFLAGDSPAGASAQEGGKGDFDDVSAVERDLASPAALEPHPPTPPAAPSPKQDLSTEILLKIADELSSIRGELVSLKTQIADVASGASTSPLAAPAAPEAQVEHDEAALSSGGFFDDEEDETIALTGDELDNILNTADFTTEEPSEPETPNEQLVSEEVPALPEEVLAPDSSSPEGSDVLDEDLLPETGDYTEPLAVEPAIEEVRLGEADSVDTVEAVSDDLSVVAEEGVVPVTNAPEDTSYLENPEDLDLGVGELPADKPLVEPDLSDFDLGGEELEPKVEVDEELPLAASEPSAESTDITLDMPAGPGYADEPTADAELLEAIPELDEPNFSEINLHEESQVPEGSTVGEAAPVPEPAPSSLDFEEEEDLVLDAIEEPAGGESSSQFEGTLGGAVMGDAADESAAAIEPAVEASDEAEASSLGNLEPPAADLPLEDTPSAGAEDFQIPPLELEPAVDEAPAAPQPDARASGSGDEGGDRLKGEIKSVLLYLDKLLDSLPEEKIEEFAKSKYFDTYKKLFEELGLV